MSNLSLIATATASPPASIFCLTMRAAAHVWLRAFTAGALALATLPKQVNALAYIRRVSK